MHLQQKLQVALYFSALNPATLPVGLQKRTARLLMEQLPLLTRVSRGIEIPEDFTVIPCEQRVPE